MVYNNYPPYQNSVQGAYQGTYPQQFQQAPQQAYPPQQVQPQPMQIQNGGFVSIRSIEEAQRYPVAPGNAVTFKIEGHPIVCEKSQGFSQLEAPRFEVFDLVKRDLVETTQAIIEAPQNNYVLHEEIEPLREGMKTLKSEVVKLKEQISEPKRNTTRTKKDGDE